MKNQTQKEEETMPWRTVLMQSTKDITGGPTLDPGHLS
jgi:hypothetical protein